MATDAVSPRPKAALGALGPLVPFGLAYKRRIAAALAERHGLALLTEWPMPLIGLDCYVMAVPDARGAEAVASKGPRLAAFVHVPLLRRVPRRKDKRRRLDAADLARAGEAVLMAVAAAARR